MPIDRTGPEYYRPDEIANEDTRRVAYWFLQNRMVQSVRRIAHCRKFDDDDLVQNAFLRMLQHRPHRKWSIFSVVCGCVRQSTIQAANSKYRHESKWGQVPLDARDEIDIPPNLLEPGFFSELKFIHGDMKTLFERDRCVVLNRFGFNGEERTYEDIGHDFGVTKSRIQQLEHRALDRLRKRFAEREAAAEQEYQHRIGERDKPAMVRTYLESELLGQV